MSGRFTTHWQETEHLKRPQKNKLQRVTLDFLPIVGNPTVHHEPPKFAGRPKVEITVDSAAHAAIHLIRYRMFGREEDHKAYCGQASLMNERQADELENILDSEDKVGKIKAEILKRNRVTLR